MKSTEFAELIKRRRKELRITQIDLAEMSGIHLRSISTIESGVANPSLDVMNKIADILGLEVTVKVKGAI